MSKITYRRAAELPALYFPWQVETSPGMYDDLDLSSGYTFTLTLTDRNGTAQLTKTTGITGGDGYVQVAWAADDLDKTPGTYVLRLRARHTASGLDRDWRPDDYPQLVIVA